MVQCLKKAESKALKSEQYELLEVVYIVLPIHRTGLSYF
jgi:hypothetical protein